MKTVTVLQQRVKQEAIPNLEFYKREAERMRAEYFAALLCRFSNLVKRTFLAGVTECKKPITSNPSVRA